MPSNKMDGSPEQAGSCCFGPGPQSGPITISNMVSRVPSTLSMKSVDVVVGGRSSSVPSSAISTLTLTPGRTRDIDQDMEALRISRQDNPYLQQILASRESLAESLEESESDDANLMSQDFPPELDQDPLSLPEIHEHMIRSPPPTSWPRTSNFRAFSFPGQQTDDDSSQESLQVRKSPCKMTSPRQSRGVLVLEEMARELLRSPASQGHDSVVVKAYLTGAFDGEFDSCFQVYGSLFRVTEALPNFIDNDVAVGDGKNKKSAVGDAAATRADPHPVQCCQILLSQSSNTNIFISDKGSKLYSSANVLDLG